MLGLHVRRDSQQADSGKVRNYALMGLSQDSAHAFRGIMSVLSGRTRCAWLQAEPTAADVLILGPQFDDDSAPALIEAARCVVRMTLTDDPHLGDVTRLEYPFRVFQVLSVLEEVEAKLGSEAVKATGVVGRNSSWSLFDAIRQYAGRTSHQQWLTSQFEDGRTLFVRDDFSVFAADDSVHADLSVGKLPQSGLTVGVAPPAELVKRPGQQLLWTVGLHSGRGNLSGTLDSSAGYKLLAWPDFGVMRPKREHLQLCALLARHLRTPEQLVAGTQLSSETVNRFLNACVLSGLLHIERNAPDLVTKTGRADLRRTGFMASLVSSIRSKLGFEQPASRMSIG